MRTKLIMLSLAAALIAIGGVAFEANATMGAGTESLLAPAKSYSPIEKASCNGRGLFCQAGPLCSASRYAFVCRAPPLRQRGSSVTNIKAENGLQALSHHSAC
jgi:hypothetical protein